MRDHLPPDAGLGDRLRASIEAGHLPAIDLADVQRRADRRSRRRTAATAVAAGAGALALVGVLAVTVPAINTVTSARTPPSADGSLADQGAAGPSGGLADPSLWADLPPVKDSPSLYLTPTAVAAASGSGAWYEPAASMTDPWTSRECSPNPLRDDPDADIGARPTGSHIEPWARQPSQPAPAPAPGQPRGLPYDAFASLAVLRWDPQEGGAATRWQQTVADEAAGCPGAVRVEPGATVAGMPAVVIARPPTSDPDVISTGSWNATAILVGGPTAVQVRYDGAPDAQTAGAAALALLREGVAAVAAGDRAKRALDAGARSGGVDEGRLSSFIDADRWEDLPALRTIGAPPQVPVVTGEDLAAALPGTRSWESQPIAGTGVDWMRSWCTHDQLVDLDTAGARDGGAPADETTSIWAGRSGVVQRPRVDVDVLRWHPRDLADTPAGGPAGVDDATLTAADAWGAAIATDATTCPGAVDLDATGLPGSHATLAAVDAGGTWRVQAVAVGGPTAVRIRAAITAADAATAGDQAVAIARRVIANTARADDIALGRPDPGPLP